MQTTMTVKGQVTVPKAMRELAGIRPGMRVEVSATDTSVTLRALPQAAMTDAEQAARVAEIMTAMDADAVDFRDGLTTDDYMASIREPLEPFEIEAWETQRPLV